MINGSSLYLHKDLTMACDSQVVTQANFQEINFIVYAFIAVISS